MTMRERFYTLAADALEADTRVAMVFAEIGVAQMPRHPRMYNVGIREQLMIGVAAGLALEGYRPVVHSYTPFVVERPFEQIKLDLGHQDVGAVLVSNGASYDASHAGRTHQAPEDVALLASLPGWTIQVPGHPDEVERVFAQAVPTPGAASRAARHGCGARRAVPRRHERGRGLRGALRPPAPAPLTRRAKRGVPPLRQARRAPDRARPRRCGHPRLARTVPGARPSGTRPGVRHRCDVMRVS